MTEHTRNIIKDTLVLVACSAVLGGLSLLISMGCQPKANPALELVTVINKAGNEEVNASTYEEAQKARTNGMRDFEKTLKKGLDAAKKDGSVFVNQKDAHGRTPIMWVCYANNNNIETTRLLEQKRKVYLAELLKVEKLDIAQTDNDGWTALHWAAWSGLDTLSDMVIEKGADINKAEKHGYTPLMLAAMRGNYPTVKLLVDKGAVLTAKNRDGKNALQLAEEGAKAYHASFDFSKTHVSKVDADKFKTTLLTELEKALSKKDAAVEELITATIGHQTKLNVAQTLKAILFSLIEGKILTQEVADKLSSEFAAKVGETKTIDVRGEAYDQTVELLRSVQTK